MAKPAPSDAARSASPPGRDAAAPPAALSAGPPEAVPERPEPSRYALRLEPAGAEPVDAARADAVPRASDAPFPPVRPASARAVRIESGPAVARSMRPVSVSPEATALFPARSPRLAASLARASVPVAAVEPPVWEPPAPVDPARPLADESAFPSPVAGVSAHPRKPGAHPRPAPARLSALPRAPRRFPARHPRSESPPLGPRLPPLASPVPPPPSPDPEPRGPTSGAV
jgi:ribonuclease E